MIYDNNDLFLAVQDVITVCITTFHDQNMHRAAMLLDSFTTEELIERAAKVGEARKKRINDNE